MCLGRVGVAHKRRCTHKAAYNRPQDFAYSSGCGGLGRPVAILGVLSFQEGAGASPHFEGCEPSVERNMRGAQVFCSGFVLHTQGGLQPPQESCYLRGVRRLAPACRKARVY